MKIHVSSVLLFKKVVYDMYYLGIDGGGTKTKAIIINSNKDIIYEATSGPTSLDTVSEDDAFAVLNDLLKTFVTENNIIFKSIFAGLGGIANQIDIKRLEVILRKLPGATPNTLITGRSDMENALASGMLFDEGIVLIAGTGMVSFGRNKSGLSHKAGGLGYKEGDLGSSYDMGIKAIQLLSKSLDGRTSPSALTDALKRELDVKDTNDLISEINMLYGSRTKIASFAKLVTTHATQGDKDARIICDICAFELALSVKAVENVIQINEPTLVIVGSLGNASGYFRDILHKKINDMIKHIKIIEPQVDPAYAACLLAFNKNT
jgi:N-acetylglucosamine kinase-like BadF-type ATPase